jgi:hypothetical protein
MAIKKCQPGVICIENITFVFIIIFVFIVSYLIYAFFKTNNGSNKININVKPVIESDMDTNRFGLQVRPNYAYSNLPNDVLMNPYMPPLRDERYFTEDFAKLRMPINISTNPGYIDTNYRQVGLLTPISKKDKSDKDKILPLLGKPIFSNRDKWNYYSMSDQNNSIKLPIISKGKSCTSENGCDMLYSGDTIYVEGYNEAFRVKMYENDTIKYLPFHF